MTYDISNIPQFFPQKCSFCHLQITSAFLLKASPPSPHGKIHGHFLLKSWKSVLSSEKRGHGNPSQWQKWRTKPFPSLQMTQFLCAIEYPPPSTCSCRFCSAVLTLSTLSTTRTCWEPFCSPRAHCSVSEKSLPVSWEATYRYPRCLPTVVGSRK